MTEQEQEDVQPAKRAPSKLLRSGSILLKICKELRVPLLCALTLAAGLLIGYVYIGKGSLREAWMFSTWSIYSN